MLFLPEQACRSICQPCLTAQAKTKLVPIVSSAKAARLIAKRWMSKYHYAPDAFVLEGPKAGGHLGFSAEELTNPEYQLEVLLPQVVQAAQEIGRERAKRFLLLPPVVFIPALIFMHCNSWVLLRCRWRPALWPLRNVMPMINLSRRI